MPEDTELSKTLSLLLAKHNVSQSGLAAELGVSRAYVSAVANGHKSMSPAKLSEVARALKASPGEEGRLHRAAALDAGFKLDLPDDF